jgi:hypothetical protein
LVSASIPATFEIVTPETAYINVVSQKYQKREVEVEISGSNFVEAINKTFKNYVKIEAIENNQYRFVQGSATKKQFTDVGFKHDGNYFSADKLEFTIPLNTVFELKRADASEQKIKISFFLFNRSDSAPLETRVELKASRRSLKHLVSVINKQLKSLLKIETELFSITPERYIIFNGFTEIGQIGKAHRFNRFTLSEHLLGILGFNTDAVFSETKIEGSRLADYTAGFKYGIVTSSIVENQFIGNDSVPVLAVIPLDRGDITNVINFEPRHLAYKKIINKELTTIRVSVYNEVGSLLSYVSDKTHPLVVTLYLRNCQ